MAVMELLVGGHGGAVSYQWANSRLLLSCYGVLVVSTARLPARIHGYGFSQLINSSALDNGICETSAFCQGKLGAMRCRSTLVVLNVQLGIHLC